MPQMWICCNTKQFYRTVDYTSLPEACCQFSFHSQAFHSCFGGYVSAVCSVQFSREEKNDGREATCPDCKSSYVMEITEAPKKYSPDLSLKSPLPANFPTPPGSAGSANDSSSCSKISESSLDSTQSVAGSAPDDRGANLGNESDIEILSNPSQSSIEVLDSRFSSRKHSTEEHRIDDTLLLGRSVEATTQTAQTTINKLKGGGGGGGTQLLTESSSSGESIRTAYEQNQTDADATNGREKKRTEVSVIGTMLGNLLQFANNKSRAEQCEPDAAFEPYKYSYSDFSVVDHRLKLYLYQHIFESSSAAANEGEGLKWLVKGRIYDENTTEPSLLGFSGFFVMSTMKFYFFKATRDECDDASVWLKRFTSGTQDRIVTIRVLPFKMGITVTIKGIGNIHFLLQDITRTDSLLLYFADNTLPDTCSLEYRVSEDLLQKLIAMTNKEKISILSLVNSITISPGSRNEPTKCLNFVTFVVTDTNLFVTTSNFKWLCASETSIGVACRQQMENLDIEVHECGPKSFRLQFKDEIHDTEEMWTLHFDTEDACFFNFDTISQSWEKHHGVPLTKVKVS